MRFHSTNKIQHNLPADASYIAIKVRLTQKGQGNQNHNTGDECITGAI